MSSKSISIEYNMIINMFTAQLKYDQAYAHVMFKENNTWKYLIELLILEDFTKCAVVITEDDIQEFVDFIDNNGFIVKPIGWKYGYYDNESMVEINKQNDDG